MDLYLINNNDKLDLHSPNKAEEDSGLVHLLKNITRKLTSNESYLLHMASQSDEVKIYHSGDESTMRKKYEKLISKTVISNGLMLAFTSIAAIVSYVPPMTFIPFISIPLITLAISNYKLLTGARKSLEKSKFMKHEEISTLENMRDKEEKGQHDFKDEFLADIYSKY